MKKIKSLVALAVLVMFFSTCDEMIPGINDDPEEVPEPTPVGFPNGIPVSKTIGAGGGTVSIDGEVNVEIPSGALTVDTEITIQPINNNAPNGNGNAYRLGPEGTTFSKPVKLTFPYTPIVDGPAITGIAFQDDDGIWYSNGKFSWNKVEGTVSTETTHFSDWTTFDELRVICTSCREEFGVYQLKVNESADFTFYTISGDVLAEDLLGPLTPMVFNDYDELADEWFANGKKAVQMTAYGKIVPTESGSTYTAPEKAPGSGKNPVNISVSLNMRYRDPATGTTFENLQLTTAVKIIGEFKYELEINYFSTDAFTGGLVGKAFIVKDYATVQVVTKDDRSIICSDTLNSPGVVIPNSQTDALGNKSTVSSDAFLGPIHVNTVSGIWFDVPGKPSQIQFIVTGDSEMPAFNWVAATGGNILYPKSSGGLMQIFYFDVSDSIPVWKNPQEIMTAKLTRKD
jgi:hypothetical protein